MELLLGLPNESLTKEIQLTQDLMKLFIDYQVPSDLLSFDGPADIETSQKIDIVKEQVNSVNTMINLAKENKVKDARQEAEFRKLQAPSARFCSSAAEGENEYDFDESCGEEEECYDEGCFDFFSDSGSFPPGPNMFTNGRVNDGRKDGECRSFFTPQGTKMPTNKTVNDEPKYGEHRKMVTQANLDDIYDFTMIPKTLDRKFEEFAMNETYAGTLRSAVIKTGEKWTRKSKPNLLSLFVTDNLYKEEQKQERERSFDLLDALSRSGTLELFCAELHVIVASSHTFDKSIVNTVIQDNINPIEKIERSNLLAVSLIHDAPCREILKNESDYKRVAEPSLLFVTEK